MAEISDFMRKWIEEDEEIDRLRAEGKLPPPDPRLQAKMDSAGGAALPGEETPWERLEHEEAAELEAEGDNPGA
jgi:hypothetical protein